MVKTTNQITMFVRQIGQIHHGVKSLLSQAAEGVGRSRADVRGGN